ncbi:hypothetical protein V6N11_062225 [Hibiscus sabdariffa]|uniref:RNase H type-1 domain-containing protein n=1 Tax=Hibiscus sabdariffa TaxID=183260 RepID=A0ABR2PRX9_9ROSI
MGSFVDPHLDPSGRPPDPMLQVELPIVLERSGSPAALEDQRNSKKSRGSGTEQGAIAIVEEYMVMDTEVEVVSDGSCESAPKNNGGAPQQVDPTIGKSSYANVVSQGRGRTGSCMGEDVLDPNSVIVLDEDCDRRRRSVLSKGSGRTSTDVGGEVTGSRFAVLSEVQNGDRMAADGVVNNQDMNAQLGQPELCGTENNDSNGTRTAQVIGAGSDAYRNSSPARRSKITGNIISMDSSLDVIPLVGGSSVAVTSHAINNTPGTHRAISIQETSGADKGSRFDDRHVGRGKGIREVNPKGVRIQKAVGVNSPNRVLLSDWVQITSHQIQAEVDSKRGRGDSGSIMEEDGCEVISPRQVPRSDATFLGGVNFKDKGGGSGDLPLRVNTILQLQDDIGEWYDDPVTLQCMALEFFSSLFASIGVGTEPYHLRGLFPVLDVGTLQALSRDVVDDEIKEVIFSMGPLKAPGVLADHLLPGSFIADGTITVASMVDDYGQWRWELFEHMLPYSVLLRIAAVRVLARGSVPDRLCWGLTPTKQFKSGSVLQRGLRMQQEAVAASVRGADGAGRVVNGAAEFRWVLSMVHSIDEVLNRPWCVRFSHIARDGNHAADWMAKLASSDDLLCHRYLSPPVSISVLLQQDAAD